MRLATAVSASPALEEAVDDVLEGLRVRLGGEPTHLFLAGHEGVDPCALRDALCARTSATFQAASSCGGALTDAGVLPTGGLAGLGIRDENGAYGVSHGELGDDPEAAGRDGARRAVAASGRPGELPGLVWLHAAPGAEEAVLAGIGSELGPSSMVFGGSSADEEVAGRWWQASSAGASGEGVTLGALYPSCRVMSGFRSGYAPTTTRFLVTSALGRTVLTLDGRPAAEVYDAATGGSLAQVRAAGGGNVLPSTTLAPLGVEQPGEGQAVHLLSHPRAVTPDDGLSTFTELEVGATVTLMSGSCASLETRAAQLADELLEGAGWSLSDVHGALLIYCAGCRLTMGDRMDRVAARLSERLGGAPMLGVFTFGEQGCLNDDAPLHGNLMISLTLFGR